MAILCALNDRFNKLWQKYVKKKERFVDKSSLKISNCIINLFFNKLYKHAREDIAC